MKSIINLKVEIIEGPDKGYVLEENNRLINLSQGDEALFYSGVKPYELIVDFVTPDLLRRYRTNENRRK